MTGKSPSQPPGANADADADDNAANTQGPEQRQYPRINLPLLVELKHPILGTHRTTAENVSAGGLFVNLPFGLADGGLQASQVKPNAKVKLRLLNAADIEPQATPTVEMIVTRVAENGVGLKFSNQTSRFLWDSAERNRVELAIGRDYFQVHISAMVQHEQKLLLLEERGHWVLPGCYLKVGETWQSRSDAMLSQQLGLLDVIPKGPIQFFNQADTEVPALATLRLFYLFTTSSAKLTIDKNSEYRDYRWLEKTRTQSDITFANSLEREMTETFIAALADD